MKLKVQPGRGQTYGLSLVWILRWSKKLCHFLKCFPQSSWSHFNTLIYLFDLGFLKVKILNFLVHGTCFLICTDLRSNVCPVYTRTVTSSSNWSNASLSVLRSLALSLNSGLNSWWTLRDSYSLSSSDSLLLSLALWDGEHWDEIGVFIKVLGRVSSLT